MLFTVLASGSKGNCCIVESNDTRLVIDCGTTQKYLKEQFKNQGIELTSLNACLVTHTHTDHISAIKLFSHLPVYAEEKIEGVNQIFIHEDECFQIGSMQIETIRLSHDVKCLGFIISDEKDKLVYVTDTGYFKEAHYDKIRNADYYIFESNHDIPMLVQSRRPEYVKNRIRSASGHLCNEDSAHHLMNCIGDKTKEIVLAHLSQEANTAEIALNVLGNILCETEYHPIIKAAHQFECVSGGEDD